MDFGIAKIVEEGAKVLTQTGSQMGTPVFMSPEQVHDSKNIDLLTDIYSLGVTLWFLLAGKPPYDTDKNSSFDIFMKINSEPLPELIDYPEIYKLIQKATEKEKNNRFSNCNEFIKIIKKDIPGIDKNIAEPTIKTDKTVIEKPKSPPPPLISPKLAIADKPLPPKPQPKTIKLPKKNNSLKISLFFGAASVILILSRFILPIGILTLLAPLPGVVGLIFSSKAFIIIRKNHHLSKSRVVKNTLYLSFFLNSFWILLFIVMIIVAQF